MGRYDFTELRKSLNKRARESEGFVRHHYSLLADTILWTNDLSDTHGDLITQYMVMVDAKIGPPTKTTFFNMRKVLQKAGLKVMPW